jgi:ClpP class serine protease
METFEVSKWEGEMGIKYNTFYRGDHKNDGNPHEHMSDSAAAEINAKLDITYDQFVASVAEHRGLEKQAVIDTQAKLFTPEQALSISFIDEIMPAQDAINAIAQKYTRSPVAAASVGLRASAMNLESQL